MKQTEATAAETRVETNEAAQEEKSFATRQASRRSSSPTMEAKRERLKRRTIKNTNQSNYLRLIEACKLKYLATIKSIINEQPELINQRDKQNRSLLHYASILVSPANKNANAGYENGDSNGNQSDTISETVISQEMANKCIECFDYLTSRCELKLWWQQDYDGLSILHLAVISSNVPLVKHVIFEHPYSIKYPLVCTLDNESHSPLHWAVITNNLDCVKLLVNYAGTKLVHEPDLNGATPLHYATQTRDYPKYKQQLKQMLKNVGQETTCEFSVQSNNGSTQFQDTTSNITSTGTTTTTTTTTTSTTSTSTNTNTTNTTNTSIKFDGTSGRSNNNSFDQDNQSRILNIVSDQLRGLEILEYLVRLPQINLECKDKDHRTPLLWAASSGNREAIVLLIDHGSNLASYDINRLSALHCAASHGFTDCVECLLSLSSTCAAQVNQVDNLNCTPLFYGVLSGNIDCIEILLDRGAKQDWQDSKGRTAAHFAALKGQLNSLKLLQKRGANLWLPNKQGDLPLHYAIKSGRQQVAKWLLENSPYEHSVNAINNFGRAPIHLAIMKNNLDMVNYLIKCGANLNQLVKVRDRTNKTTATTTTTGAGLTNNNKQITLVNDSSLHRIGKGGSLYRYETALDMAKKLNHGQCLQVLLDNQALSAAQVIRKRINDAPPSVPSSKNANSLFDIQSIEGPSPIGFETSYSSSGASPSMNLIDNSSRVPKLSRPVPDTLPQSDSTGSSALSHNSLTSVRGEPTPIQLVGGESYAVNNKQAPERFLPRQPSIRNQQNQTTAPLVKEHSLKQDHDSDGDGAGGGNERAETVKPNKGGISYNNEHFNASIKYKLYNQDSGGGQETRPPPHHHFNHRSFPEPNEPRHMKPQKSINGRAVLSAPLDHQQRPKGQEIITNVNVYTSPCPHCAHHNSDFCSECRKLSNRDVETSTITRQQQRRNSDKQQQQQVRKDRQIEDGLYSDETSDIATSASEDTETEILNNASRLPNLSISRQQPLLQQQQQQLSSSTQRNNNLQESDVATGFKVYLPPSQNHEQHLPVIISDQEQSTSAGISPDSPRFDPYEEGATKHQKQISGQYNKYDGSVTMSGLDEDIDVRQKQEKKGLEQTSPALQEPRFDRSRRHRDGQRFDRYRDQVRSPVAEYIHTPLGGSSYFGGGNDRVRPVSLNRDENMAGFADGSRSGLHYTTSHKTDYSQVKAKVDSHRLQYDDPIRSKSMSMLNQHQQQHQHHHQHQQQQYSRSPYYMPYNQQQLASRSVSRQTVIKRRGSGSVDSLELTTKVEKSIRKHRQEAKLFEELQNLKRSQIRSGRANEALLVKRLVDHFTQDTFNLIGLDTSYHGPYTYQSYERFLYDQLRKLSQSNCAKLAAQIGDEEASAQLARIDGDQFQQPTSSNLIANNDLSTPLSDQHFFEEDMKAELELRRVIEGADHNVEDESGSFVKRPSDDDEIRAGIKSIDREKVHDSEKSEKLGDDVDGDDVIEKKVKDEGIESEKKEEEEEDLETGTGGDAVDKHQQVAETSEVKAPRKASSASSSRRSSVDIEREKLINLPLTTSEQQQAIELDEEARSLSSCIIVDALGNVSRAGSAASRRQINKQEKDENGASASNMNTSSSSDSNGSVYGESEFVEEVKPDEEEEEEAEPPKPSQSSNRRRSVVNIGNKMEVIYHDVGIEIDSALESDNSGADPENMNKDKESGEQQVAPSSSSSSNRFRDEGLEEVKEEGPDDVDTEQQQAALSETGPSETRPKSLEEGEEQAGETEDSMADTVVETHPLNRQDSRKTSNDSSVKSSQMSGRRVSSPPDFLNKDNNRLTDSDSYNWSRSQRASSIGTTDIRGRDSQVKKVFNGYDLDKMHIKRSSEGTSGSPKLKSRTTSKEKATQVTDDDDDGGGGDSNDSNISEIEEKPDYIALEARRRSSLASKQQQSQLEDALIDEQPADTSKLDLKQEMGRHRRRLPRSRLIKRKYTVKVPIEDVRDRWYHIKAAERKRKAKIEKALGVDSQQVELIDDSSKQARSHSLIDRGQQDRTLYSSKSQQNLKKSSTIETIYGDENELRGIKDDSDLNFELLYELNKSLKLANSQETNKSKRSDSNKLRWCHKKAVKIVDVRTLKRTLSLPESLIYSNDLLKRFNILKL